MKTPAIVLAAFTLLPVVPALAGAHDGIRLGDLDCCSEPVRWSGRHDADRARFAITTEDGKVTLLLTERVVAFQLSDRSWRKVDRELHRARHDDDDGPLGEAIKSAVIGAVRSFLDHSAECPVSELRDVRYDGGRLVFVARDGDRVFEHFEVDDDDLLESFDPGDAERFVREFRRVASRPR